jgi:hypothetical protein
MATTITAVSADVDFTGTELTIQFEYEDATSPYTMPARIGRAFSEGLPTLKKSGQTDPLRLIVTGCDWEVERDPNNVIRANKVFMICRARYRIHDSDRVVKAPFISPPTYTVSAAAGLVKARDENSETGISSAEIPTNSPLTVTNRSFVASDGWADKDSQGYDGGLDPPDYRIWVNAETGVDTNSGFSESTPIKTIGRLLTVLGGLTNARPHQVFFARGQVFCYGGSDPYGAGITQLLLPVSGNSSAKRLWIGSYLPSGAPSTTPRPRIVCGKFIAKSNTHVDGLEIQLHEQEQDRLSLGGDTGAANISAQDCIFVNSRNLQIDNLDRCTVIGYPRAAPASNGRLNPTGIATTTMEVTQCFFVGKPGELVGHGWYELPPSYVGTRNRKSWWGVRSRIRDCVFVYNTLQDFHRSRAEHQYCCLTRIVDDLGGHGPIGGVNARSTFSGATYNSGTQVLTMSRSSPSTNFLSTELAEEFNNAEDYWLDLTWSGGLGLREVTSLTYDSTNFYFGLASAPGSATTGISGKIGDGPWRMRNQNYSYLVSFNAGWLSGSSGHVFGIGTVRDLAGYWHWNCLAVQSANVSATTNQTFIINPRYSADNKPDVIDVTIENITIARCYNSSFMVSGLTYDTSKGVLRRCIGDTIRNSQEATLMGLHYNEDSNTVKLNWEINHNLYVVPSTQAQNRFHMPSHATQFQTLTQWQSNAGMDANSVLVATVAFDGNSATTYHPDLGDYDSEVLPKVAPYYSGENRQIHIAALMASRAYRTWQYSWTAEAMVRWALRKYKPTNEGSTWPSYQQTWHNGWADYKINAPASVTATKVSSVATISWAAPTQTRVTRHVIRWGYSSSNLDNEVEVWGSNTVQFNVNQSLTVYYAVYATDGWAESPASTGSI